MVLSPNSSPLNDIVRGQSNNIFNAENLKNNHRKQSTRQLIIKPEKITTGKFPKNIKNT